MRGFRAFLKKKTKKKPTRMMKLYFGPFWYITTHFYPYVSEVVTWLEACTVFLGNSFAASSPWLFCQARTAVRPLPLLHVDLPRRRWRRIGLKTARCHWKPARAAPLSGPLSPIEPDDEERRWARTSALIIMLAKHAASVKRCCNRLNLCLLKAATSWHSQSAWLIGT